MGRCQATNQAETGEKPNPSSADAALRCPHCGYCPHCGRSDPTPAVPAWPSEPTYVQPTTAIEYTVITMPLGAT